MLNNNTIEALKSLTENQDEKPEIEKLRELFVYIEETLANGVSQKKVYATLKASLNLKMSLGTFQKNLSRIRKKNNTYVNIYETFKLDELTKKVIDNKPPLITDDEEIEKSYASLTPLEMKKHWKTKLDKNSIIDIIKQSS